MAQLKSSISEIKVFAKTFYRNFDGLCLTTGKSAVCIILLHCSYAPYNGGEGVVFECLSNV